jgi:hypothetical protein
VGTGLPLPVGSYALDDVRAGCRRLVNCFAQAAPQTPQLGPNPDDSKEKAPPVVLTRAWGISTLADDGTTNSVRGMSMMQGVVYVVIGPTLYTMSKNGALTQVGTGIVGGGPVRMCDNTACLAILVAPSTLYTYTPSAGLAQVTASGFTSLGAIDLGYVDTYIVFLQRNGGGFFNDDGKAVSGAGPITFTQPSQFLREFGTDMFVGMGIDHRAITMLGTNTGETYLDVGNTVGSPFASAPDGFLEIGCAGPYTIAKQDQALFWLANDLTVRRRSGQTPLRVSNHGIESILALVGEGGPLAASTNLGGAYSLAYSYGGHLFYALTIPSISRTVVLDVTTGEWHELSSFGLGYWRPSCALQAYGMQLVGDSQSGKVGYLDPTVCTEFGSPQTMSWTHQPVYSANARISHRRLELMLGAGLASSFTTTPKVTLQVSDDGGMTFRSFPVRTLGARGATQARAVWTNLGTSRQRVYKFSLSDELDSTFVPDVTLDAVPGRA